MNSVLKPIYLFADSQLLFWRNQGELFLRSILRHLPHQPVQAAYIGASNGDDPQFYSIFESAMQAAGIYQCRMIPSRPTPEDLLFLADADLALLAGGDVARGWNVFSANGVREFIIRKYHEGRLLIGISAGAVQLGLCGFAEDAETPNQLINTFKLVPFIIGAHEEKQHWQSLVRSMHFVGDSTRAIGIPTGGGMIVYPDHRVEAIRHPLIEFSILNSEIIRRSVDVNQS